LNLTTKSNRRLPQKDPVFSQETLFLTTRSKDATFHTWRLY